MLRNEASSFIEKVIAPLWKEWEATKEETDLWCKALYSFTWDVARVAIENVRMDSDWKEPKLKAFRVTAFELSEKVVKEKKPIPEAKLWYFNPETGHISPVYIDPICDDHEVGFLSRVAHKYLKDRGLEERIEIIEGTHANARAEQLGVFSRWFASRPKQIAVVDSTETACPNCGRKINPTFLNKLTRKCNDCGLAGCYECFSVPTEDGNFKDECPKCSKGHRSPVAIGVVISSGFLTDAEHEEFNREDGI